MAVSGISGVSGLDYRSMVGILGLSASRSQAKYQAVSAIKAVESVSSKTSSYSDTIKFLQNYNKELTELEKTASRLQESDRNSVFNDYRMTSSNSSVAEATGTYRLQPETAITLEVNSTAKAQKNVSKSHNSQDFVEDGADMNFTISSDRGDTSVSITGMNDNGTKKTYNQMYQEAAKMINSDPGSGVTASVVNEEGKVSLVLEGKEKGVSHSFTVSGTVGSADGLASVSEAAEDTVYTVTQDGVSYTGRSESNRISLDYGRIEAEIKGTGKTELSVEADPDKIVSAVRDLVDQYNSVTDTLHENTDRGTGAAAQYETFNRGMAAEKTLNYLGITYNKSGKMELNEETLKSVLKDDYEGTKELIGGQFGIASKIAQRTDSALSSPVQRIVNKDLASTASSASSEQKLSFQYFSNFARSSPYSLGNYYTVGLLLNTMA